jgi:hypothetical protein
VKKISENWSSYWYGDRIRRKEVIKYKRREDTIFKTFSSCQSHNNVTVLQHQLNTLIHLLYQSHTTKRF